MPYLFTSESVSEGHPDKIADQISDAILDAYMAVDPSAKVACEVFVTTGLVVVGGEFRSQVRFPFEPIIREVIRNIGYDKPEYFFDYRSCAIVQVHHEQSPDIAIGVDRGEEIGAGDQGLMFGYAVAETPTLMPLPIDLAHKLMAELAYIRKNTELMPYLGPDAKSQVTIFYGDDGLPQDIHTILISTQHKEPRTLFPNAADPDLKMIEKIREDIINFLLPRVAEHYTSTPRIKKMIEDFTGRAQDGRANLLVNPTGRFVIGGPHGDTGLTGRKVIVDTYGGRAPHGGGAFSGKDCTKVDRSASYAARYIAKNIVKAGLAKEVTIQLSYAIGVPEPVSVTVWAKGKHNNISDRDLEQAVRELFPLTPRKIINTLSLASPIYLPSAVYGHMGREPFSVRRKIAVGKETVERQVELFPWEKTDMAQKLLEYFNLSPVQVAQEA